ncbi:MAG: hypothetical protein WC899_02225 [bacterium]
MGIKEDKEDFNETGLLGVLRKLMTERDEGFIKVLEGEWRGEVILERPALGSGPYLHYKKGSGVVKYRNYSVEDTQGTNFPFEV